MALLKEILMTKLQVIGITTLSLFISSYARVPHGSEEQVTLKQILKKCKN